MRRRVLLFILLAANLVLAMGWIFSERRQVIYQRALNAVPAPLTQVKTNVVLRRQFFTWQQVESDNYPIYISNLRSIGCPEQTVRDIIIADVNAVYARKRATEVVTTEQQWWRTEPDTNIIDRANEQISELDAERRGLLTSLLGAGWESGDQISLPRPSRVGLNLDGPVLGVLTPEVKQAVQAINARSQDQIELYVQTQRAAGKTPDPAEIARMQKQAREELAKVLPPAELEEYLLRFSRVANDLRNDLIAIRYFNTTPDEFRAMFRATDSIDQRLQMLAGATDYASVQERDALIKQRTEALKLALGTKRYEEYVRLHDPGYRDAFASAQQAGQPDAASTIFQINQASAEELNRIRGNTNLSAQQLAIELKQAEIEQLKAQAAALGQDVPSDAPPQPPKPPQTVHRLIAGESLQRIIQLYGVDPNALRAANPNINLNQIKPGDSINVPLPSSPFSPIPIPQR